ncbi:CobQ/CobB/MinD/ParA nucleotide binding domain-containing protein [Tranquillimonas rosea]|uniref:CobQ/CobB/MinD/ParA nucleotide binding domain-containing protein n=1 Tax=Tranquillimonas rosea TaxID=641238 RepID=A0A1H9WCL3_9RHOB|nr:ParA family protein [Tranquillimonas rosea]SES31529.1 CobQ/CobB/MinD/ParA nucleotide binding domain-containing protein [Tranquillimonas rosea]
MSKRIVIFNHKGGVSKTTSAYNIGWAMAEKHRILLVDGDPQCNLTSLVLGERFEEYYLNNDTKKNNIKDGVSPAFRGTPTPIVSFDCPSPEREGNLFLLPGHADLSEFDASLTLAFTSTSSLAALQNLPGAFSALLDAIEEEHNIDYTIIDMNPGLSPINQDLFLLSHGFMLPTNPDPFSIMAIQTLTKVLPRWVNWKKTNEELFSEATYKLPSGAPKFFGALIQRFNVRNGVAAKPYRDNIAEIQAAITDELVPTLGKYEMALAREDYGEALVGNGYCLSEIPDFQGLLPKSLGVGVPVFKISDDEIGETGPVLEGMVKNRDKFKESFSSLTGEVLRLAEYV